MRTIGLVALCCVAGALVGCRASTEPVAVLNGADAMSIITPTVVTDLGPRAEGGDGCAAEEGWEYEWSSASDVNANGVVVGQTLCIAMEYLTFRWMDGVGMQQLANYPGGYAITGGSINSEGYIAAAHLSIDAPSFSPTLWTPANTRVDLAPGWAGSSLDINDRNAVVGLRYQGMTPLPFRWTPATGLVDLPALGTRTPVAINRQGDIAAISRDGTAILASNGTRTLIGGFLAQDMSDSRAAVGAIGAWPTPTAALWSPSGGIRSLGTLGGDMSYAYGMNNEGEVVGASMTTSGDLHAFYWSASRGMVDLGRGEAVAISDRGHIVGTRPTGLINVYGSEVWHATMWRGTGGVTTPAPAARAIVAPAGREAVCFNDAVSWQTKTGMIRCLAGQR